MSPEKTHVQSKEREGEFRTGAVAWWRKRLLDTLEEVAGYLLSAGQFSLAAMVAYFFWPRYFISICDYLGISYLFVVVVLAVLMFLSTPLLLYSGSVGLSRMGEIRSREWRIIGIITAALMFLQGFANAIIPLVLLVLYASN